MLDKRPGPLSWSFKRNMSPSAMVLLTDVFLIVSGQQQRSTALMNKISGFGNKHDTNKINLLLVWLSYPLKSKFLICQWNFTLEPWSTFRSPGSEGAVVINDVVEGEGDDEEGAVTGRVHLERYVPLVQSHRLALLCQGRLKQLPRHLGAKMESINVAKRLEKASCNQKAPGLIPSMANVFINSDDTLNYSLSLCVNHISHQLHSNNKETTQRIRQVYTDRKWLTIQCFKASYTHTVV